MAKKQNKGTVMVKIKSVLHGKFIKLSDNNKLHASAYNADKGEIFVIVPLDSNEVKLKIKGGNYVKIDSNGSLIVDKFNRGAKFKLYYVSKTECIIMCQNGHYLELKDNGNEFIARGNNVENRALFKFKKA